MRGQTSSQCIMVRCRHENQNSPPCPLASAELTPMRLQSPSKDTVQDLCLPAHNSQGLEPPAHGHNTGPLPSCPQQSKTGTACPRTQYRTSAFLPRAVKDWNRLPMDTIQDLCLPAHNSQRLEPPAQGHSTGPLPSCPEQSRTGTACPRTQYRTSAFLPRAVKDWNRLPKDTVQDLCLPAHNSQGLEPPAQGHSTGPASPPPPAPPIHPPPPASPIHPHPAPTPTPPGLIVNLHTELQADPLHQGLRRHSDLIVGPQCEEEDEKVRFKD